MSEVKRQVAEDGIKNVGRDALEKVITHYTSFDEAIRVTGVE